MDSTDVRHRWADRSGEYSPEFYAHYGPDGSTEAVCQLLESYVARDGAVLELGCSSGRHLARLRERGFDSLAGLDVNPDAFDVMADAYPDLAAEGTFYRCAIEDAVSSFDDGQFDAIYSVETLQHVHPDLEWVFPELARLTSDLLVTVENEGETDRADRETGRTDREAGRADQETDRTDAVDVTSVDGLPLYHRDWSEIFQAAGLVEVAVGRHGGDTIRAFRSTGT